jgi:hypothetical protein
MLRDDKKNKKWKINENRYLINLRIRNIKEYLLRRIKKIKF